jgi:hypothetical protein
MADETQMDVQVDTNAAAETTPETVTETAAAESTAGKTLLDEVAGEEVVAPETAPEEYGEFEYPDGIEPDLNLVGKFAPVAKDLGLSQEKAQKVVSVYAEHIKSEIAAYETKVAEAKAADRKEIESIANYRETILAPAKRALSLVSEADRTRITQHYGDDPAVLRLLAKVGQKMGEDRTVEGKSAPPGAKPSPESLYKPMT